jgi:hypothetical protein
MEALDRESGIVIRYSNSPKLEYLFSRHITDLYSIILHKVTNLRAMCVGKHFILTTILKCSVYRDLNIRAVVGLALTGT